MSLFDFLRPKKKAIPDILSKPEMKYVKMSMGLEFLQKQVANLKVVGRTDEARKMVAEYVEEYSRIGQGFTSTPHDIARLSYRIAYLLLPDLVHKRWDEFLRLWSDGIPFPIYLALLAAAQQEQPLTPKQILGFEAEAGHLRSDVDYYLIRFPTPPMFVNIPIEDLMETTSPGSPRIWKRPPPTLGPYFVAVLHDRGTGERHLYILSQAPDNSTTLRCVTADGANCNCGAGPTPSIEAFLELLRQQPS